MKINKLKYALVPLIAVAGILSVRAADNMSEGKMPMEPIPAVLENYIKIQGALAKDSVAGISEAATAINKLVKEDKMKMISGDVAKEAEALSKAKDVNAARKAFKPLSESLIKSLEANKVQTGKYFEAHCPMVNASWLQTDKNISNPYDSGMAGCGEIKRNF